MHSVYGGVRMECAVSQFPVRALFALYGVAITRL
jgi:hypothetical protein